MKDREILNEIERLKKEFSGSDDQKLEQMSGLIEQAATERILLKRLNEIALKSGLVRVHPENPERQRSLPVSGEITRHAAALTNITDKLMKHLSTDAEEEDDGMGDYE